VGSLCRWAIGDEFCNRKINTSSEYSVRVSENTARAAPRTNYAISCGQMSEYSVIPYNIQNLVECLSQKSLATNEQVKGKLHTRYFEDYFLALNAKTVVIEPNYVDHDFLEDYAAYYVSCFEKYCRYTTRLHFFDIDFTDADFTQILISPSAAIQPSDLNNAYLGFVIVKCLPITIIGRTCLKTYPDDNGRRSFPILREYSTNLFGIELKVQSLAFQEQDTVVAACATSALWSCFQGTGKLFQHSIPSPVEITKVATDHVPENLPGNSARALPNSGLTATQMALAVRDVGLEPYIIGTPDQYSLNSALYAYLRCHIPLILTIHLVNVNGGNEQLMGGHGVAITGFSLGNNTPVPFGPSGFLLRASRIDKIYAHDDQVGPFAKMEHIVATRYYLKTSWQASGIVEARPWFLLLPLYHKIRIPFDLIHGAAIMLDAIIEPARAIVMPTMSRVEWDIHLTTVNDFKSDILKNMKGMIPESEVASALTVDLPRFMWRVTALIDNSPNLDLLFDATGIAQHKLLVHVVESGQELSSILRALSKNIVNTKNAQVEAVFDWFKQN